jgi:hypothetical protein
MAWLGQVGTEFVDGRVFPNERRIQLPIKPFFQVSGKANSLSGVQAVVYKRCGNIYLRPFNLCKRSNLVDQPFTDVFFTRDLSRACCRFHHACKRSFSTHRLTELSGRLVYSFGLGILQIVQQSDPCHRLDNPGANIRFPPFDHVIG